MRLFLFIFLALVTGCADSIPGQGRVTSAESPGAARSQEESTVPVHELLVAAKLPEGYELKPPVQVTAGVFEVVLITRPQGGAAVSINILHGDMSTVPFRRVHASASVNGLADTLATRGFTNVFKKQVPDFERLSFTEPVSVELVFTNGEGKKQWLHQEIFFTDTCFSVNCVADDPETLAVLTKWAKTVKPRTKRGAAGQ